MIVMILGDVMVLVGYSDCETDCCIVLSDYLIYAISEVYD